MPTTATAARIPIVTQSELIQAGVTPVTADALVEAFEKASQRFAWKEDLANLATKDDLIQLKSELKTELKTELKAELKTEIRTEFRAELKSALSRYMTRDEFKDEIGAVRIELATLKGLKGEMVALRWMQGMTLMLVSLLVGQMLLNLGG